MAEEEIAKKKMQLEQKQLYDIQEKEKMLLDRLDQIERSKKEEEEYNAMIRQKVVEYKLLQKRQREEQERMERQHWNVEREQKMEDFVRKKLELEQIQQKRDYVENIEKRRKVEVEQIKKERDLRDLKDAELLQKALKHADAIQEQVESGVIDEAFQATLANVLLAPESEENK